MIDSAQLKRLMVQIGSCNPYVGPSMLMLPVAQAAYKIGAKRMQERAVKACLTTSDSAVSSSCAEAIRKLESGE